MIVHPVGNDSSISGGGKQNSCIFRLLLATPLISFRLLFFCSKVKTNQASGKDTNGDFSMTSIKFGDRGFAL